MHDLTRLGPELTVTRLGDVTRISRPQHPGLAPWVHERAAYLSAAGAAYTARLLPTGHITLVVNLGPAFTRMTHNGDADLRPGPAGSLVIGPEDRPGVCAHPGGQRTMRVQLTPPGAHRLFGLPLAELANSVQDLRDVLGPAAAELDERLDAAPTWTERFDILDAALLTRVLTGPRVAPQVAMTWRALATVPGTASVADLAREAGWSHKHLLRRFTRQVGLTPKALARVARFQHAVDRLSRPGSRLADVSSECGYYDQAHLNRDFRMLGGVSPGQYAAAAVALPRALPLPP